MRGFSCILELSACWVSVLLAVSLCWGSTFCEGRTPHLIYLGCSSYLHLEVIGAPVLGTEHQLLSSRECFMNTPIHAAGFSLGFSELSDFLCSSSPSQSCESHIQVSADCSESLLSFQCRSLMAFIYLPPKRPIIFTQLEKALYKGEFPFWGDLCDAAWPTSFKSSFIPTILQNFLISSPSPTLQCRTVWILCETLSWSFLLLLLCLPLWQYHVLSPFSSLSWFNWISFPSSASKLAAEQGRDCHLCCAWRGNALHRHFSRDKKINLLSA